MGKSAAVNRANIDKRDCDRGRKYQCGGADTWYPSGAADGNLHSPWTDGAVGEVDCYEKQYETGFMKDLLNGIAVAKLIRIGLCLAVMLLAPAVPAEDVSAGGWRLVLDKDAKW